MWILKISNFFLHFSQLAPGKLYSRLYYLYTSEVASVIHYKPNVRHKNFGPFSISFVYHSSITTWARCSQNHWTEMLKSLIFSLKFFRL